MTRYVPDVEEVCILLVHIVVSPHLCRTNVKMQGGFDDSLSQQDMWCIPILDAVKCTACGKKLPRKDKQLLK